MFDVSQTDGEPLPELDTAASGEASAFVSRLTDAAEDLGVTARVVPEAEWSQGNAKGVCTQQCGSGSRALIKVRDRSNRAHLVGGLLQEYAHALLHIGVTDDTERSKREVKAEAAAYKVDHYFGLDMSGSAFYLLSWKSDDATVVQERLKRINSNVQEIVDVLET